MEFYNLDIFTEDYHPVPYMEYPFYITFSGFMKSCKSPSDKLMIKRILGGLQDEDTWHPQFVADVFAYMYDDFLRREGGNNAGIWINHTIDIVYTFGHRDLDRWLEWELERIEGHKLSVQDTLLRNKDKFLKEGVKTGDVLKEIALSPYTNYSYSYLRKIYYEMDKLSPPKIRN
jgi:hypothetical protein